MVKALSRLRLSLAHEVTVTLAIASTVVEVWHGCGRNNLLARDSNAEYSVIYRAREGRKVASLPVQHLGLESLGYNRHSLYSASTSLFSRTWYTPCRKQVFSTLA